MSLGFGFSMLDSHKRAFLIHGNIFSVSCELISDESDSISQGCLMGGTDDLRGLPDEVGLTISADTGLGTVNDSFEFCLDINDVKIGKPLKGWKLFFPDRQGNINKYLVEENIVDRTAGLYRLQLCLLTEKGKVNRLGNTRRKPRGAL